MNSLKNFKFSKMLFIFFVALIFVVSGCQEKEGVTVQEQVEKTEVSASEMAKNDGLLHPWVESRYDYDYLSEKLEEANQYLTKNTLTLEDLKQIQEIGNIICGEYRDFYTYHFDKRTPGLMDPELFDSEYSMWSILELLIDDFSGEKRVKNTHKIHIITDHIGEQDEYIFVAFTVYRLYNSYGKEKSDPILLQFKKDSNAKYGFYIVNGEYACEAFEDPYLEKGWKLYVYDNYPEYFQEYFAHAMEIKEIDYWLGNIQEPIYELSYSPLQKKKEGGKYDRRAACEHAFEYAYSPCQDYYYWEDSDCANFGSQCLAAGGLPQNKTWRYYPNGYSSGTPAWRGALDLYRYLVSSGYAEQVTTQGIWDTYYNVKGTSSPLRWGDIVFINNNTDDKISLTGDYKKNMIRHTLVLNHVFYDPTDYYKGTPKWAYSAHSYNRRDADLVDIVGKRLVNGHAVGIHITY